MDEARFRQNLALIRSVSERASCDIIIAFKAFALWRTFPILREYVSSATASGLYEARLAREEMGCLAHTYSPAFKSEDFEGVMECSSHVTFNSLTQFETFIPAVRRYPRHISCGLRINPEYSEIETELYNPCAPGSRFGVLAADLPDILPEGIEGFHCHCHCESGAEALQRTLVHIEERFARWFTQIKWLNLGGGHLMTREGYDIELLTQIIQGLHERYPWLRIILEPGSAFAWRTGELVASVVDIVENKGVRTAILDVSFTCHMPDCLEMPYQPAVQGAQSLAPDATGADVFRLGGNSCLSGDFMGTWRFPHGLRVGDRVVFEDMIHYTTVKTTMFNGMHHPALLLRRIDGKEETLRQFAYEDYRDRMC